MDVLINVVVPVFGIVLTGYLAGQVPGLKAHVVINSNRYAVIDHGPYAVADSTAAKDRMVVRDFGEDGEVLELIPPDGGGQ